MSTSTKVSPRIKTLKRSNPSFLSKPEAKGSIAKKLLSGGNSGVKVRAQSSGKVPSLAMASAPLKGASGGKGYLKSPATGGSRKVNLEVELATQLVSELDSVSPDVNALCNSYGLRREELSRLTGFSLRALADWSAGKLPSQPAQRRLQEIRRLLDALSEIVTPSSISGWMRRPNPAFDKLAPLQVIELGEIDRLWEMVHQRA
ncbi:MAG: DUF2384 domain-containing protein [Verrucomicrobia bacterium]|nr:DUF2384 domain-containing protein [Verrucomicrobiota bacterium]